MIRISRHFFGGFQVVYLTLWFQPFNAPAIILWGTIRDRFLGTIFLYSLFFTFLVFLLLGSFDKAIAMVVLFVGFILVCSFGFFGWLRFLGVLKYLIQHVPNFSLISLSEVVHLTFLQFKFAAWFLELSFVQVECGFMHIRTLSFS